MSEREESVARYGCIIINSRKLERRRSTKFCDPGRWSIELDQIGIIKVNTLPPYTHARAQLRSESE